MASNCDIYNFKVVLLGEGCVGKTSLLLRYVDDKFSSKHETTLQASFMTKKINVNGKHVNLSIWDTAGQERFHSLGPIYYRSSNGALLVYDITDEDSFQKVKIWVKELIFMLGTNIVLLIVGNKTDLESMRQVNIDDAVKYADSVGARYFETSAKLNDGVEELFLEITNAMIEEHDFKQRNNTSELSRTHSMRRSNVLIVDEDSDESINGNTQRSKCCGGGNNTG